MARGGSLFETILVFENYPREVALRQGGVGLGVVDVQTLEQNSYALSLMAVPGEELLLDIEYDGSRFHPTTVERLLRNLCNLLEGMTARLLVGGEGRLAELPLLAEPECFQVLVEWNSTDRSWECPQRLHELFERQVDLTPEAVALVSEEGLLTYAELDRRATRLAHRLQGLGVGPEVPVGLCAERSLGMVEGLLAILQAGGAYVPLDPDYPRERLAFMLEDTGAPVLVVQRHLLARLPDAAAQVVLLEEIGRGADLFESRLQEGSPENLAYVIYTSGSTGRPKGVMVTHRAIANRVLWMREQFPVGPNDAVLQKTPFSFDASIWEIFLPLLAGFRLVIALPQGHQDPAYMARAIQRHEVTVLQLVPSMLGPFLDEPTSAECPSLRRVFCGGELLTPPSRDRFLATLAAELCNLYGPTECAIDATFWPCRGGDERPSVPIGRPLSNVQIYLLDRRLEPAAVCAPGELHVGGVGLARGYLGRPDLTAEKFIPDPWSGEEGARLYRTGDLARYLPDGAIEYLGRIDQQVKLRGFRIEPGEIEAALGALPGVREAVVIVREDRPGQVRLLAYAAGAGLNGDRLRRTLERTLPSHMVPALVVVLEALPRTPGGKLDRKVLPAPERGPAEGRYEAPHTPTEELLARIWAQVLGLERVGVHDNFFELGGDSILSIQVMARTAQAGCCITPRQIFEHQTVAELAVVAGTAVEVKAFQGPVTGPVPLTPIQRWFLETDPIDPYHFNQALLLTVQELLAFPTLERALMALLEHHDALRLRFERSKEGWRQWNAPPADSGERPPLIQVDLSRLGRARGQQAIEEVGVLVQESLDLARGPLVRAVWFEPRRRETAPARGDPSPGCGRGLLAGAPRGSGDRLSTGWSRRGHPAPGQDDLVPELGRAALRACACDAA